uniref:Uncharacterized protein n=1 Tax=Vitis vinifera TaxID=29760 RepID=F6HLG0_VITVI
MGEMRSTESGKRLASFGMPMKSILWLTSRVIGCPRIWNVRPTAADDQHLPHLSEDGVSAQNIKSTIVILALHENKIQHHQQAYFRLQRRCVLGFSHHLGVRFGSLGQEIVHHEHRRRLVGHGGLSNSHGDGFRGADNVVEVEVEVAELLFVETHRYGRNFFGETVGFLAGATAAAMVEKKIVKMMRGFAMVEKN